MINVSNTNNNIHANEGVAAHVANDGGRSGDNGMIGHSTNG